MTDPPADILEIVNSRLSGFNETLGLRFTRATPEEYAAELTVDERHLQPYGLVHGGVYASMVETVCSVGAAVGVFFEGKTAVGLDNSAAAPRPSTRAGAPRSGRPRSTTTATGWPPPGECGCWCSSPGPRRMVSGWC